MQVSVDQTMRQKLIVTKGANRYFAFEFPADCDTAELYGVAKTMKAELWKAVEAENNLPAEAEPVEETITKEDIEKVVPIETVTPEVCE